MTVKRALVIENPQIDYFSGGSLEVPEADSLLPLFNELIPAFDMVIITLEWHPANHVSFAATYPWRQIGQVIEVNEVSVELKPIHCVQKTFGAMVHPGLFQKEEATIIHKGITDSLDDYSAFYNKGNHPTELHDLLQSKEINEVYLAGVVLEDNILTTLEDGIRLGYNMSVVKSACKGRISAMGLDNLWKYIASQGGQLV